METNIDYQILEEIINVSSRISGLQKSKISINSSINNDLKIDGDDIVELIEELVFKYDLNTQNFDYNKYFSWEKEANILAQFRNLYKAKAKIQYDVKILDLYNWAINKDWNEINGSD